ncbi:MULTISPECIES: hypothetical protein [Bacillus]|uniref:hypothetical protein n=1 Tax=Bacillus TaxID=1386 RepID=UPI000364FCB0|nr:MULTISPECIES: hypothetical protein [Bacillus]
MDLIKKQEKRIFITLVFLMILSNTTLTNDTVKDVFSVITLLSVIMIRLIILYNSRKKIRPKQIVK